MSAIEWTDKTWNPVTGCDRVSPGCAHCYALDLAARLKGMGQARYQKDGDPKTSGPGFGVTLHRDKIEEPLRWRKPRMVFVNSMSDVFHDEIPDAFIAHMWTTMARAEQHTFQVLTKRPERMAELVPQLAIRNGAPLPNVWCGVSIENRRYSNRADLLRATPAAVRFISAEPLLGPLVHHCPVCLGGGVRCTRCDGFADVDLVGIDWLIVGGESGSRARPVDPVWVTDLLDLAQSRDTAFFFKQWGGRTPKAGGRVLDGRTWDEFPRRMEVAA